MQCDLSARDICEADFAIAYPTGLIHNGQSGTSLFARPHQQATEADNRRCCIVVVLLIDYTFGR